MENNLLIDIQEILMRQMKRLDDDTVMKKKEYLKLLVVTH